MLIANCWITFPEPKYTFPNTSLRSTANFNASCSCWILRSRSTWNHFRLSCSQSLVSLFLLPFVTGTFHFWRTWISQPVLCDAFSSPWPHLELLDKLTKTVLRCWLNGDKLLTRLNQIRIQRIRRLWQYSESLVRLFVVRLGACTHLKIVLSSPPCTILVNWLVICSYFINKIVFGFFNKS